jgi:restriction system protein
VASYWVQRQRELERQRREQERAYARQIREAERRRRELAREQALEEKERKRLYLEHRQAEVSRLNDQLTDNVSALRGILAATLLVDDHIDFEALKERPDPPPFEAGSLDVPINPPEFAPPPSPRFFQKLVPGTTKRHQAELAEAEVGHQRAVAEAEEQEHQRVDRLEAARAEHERSVVQLKEDTEAQNREVDAFKEAFERGEPEAVVNYFTMVLTASRYPDGFPRQFKLAHVPESKQLVVEYDLPSPDIAPATREYRYIKSKDEVAEAARPASERKGIYGDVVAQLALRSLHELFESDRDERIETVVFNGYVDTVDRRTGQPTRPCLVTVRASRDVFNRLDLSRVEPAACLKGLNASVSRSPSELVPVRPVLEFNMVDPRFVDHSDVLSSIDQRPNLMELTPSEFEALITDLFEKMGLETRLTQASRDGGVDCVAYDPRPIFGGKVVIQAKRYKNTVGVSAVRDLFGTMQNEGASKGILVCTSGYGKASFEFADGKPLELLSGSNLLYLLEQHAGVEAKIEVPEDWVDPVPDAQTESEPAVNDPNRSARTEPGGDGSEGAGPLPG